MSDNFIIEGTVFYGVSYSEPNSLNTITVPDGITEIGDFAFVGGGKLFKSSYPQYGSKD